MAGAELGSRRLRVCESRGESWQQELRGCRGWATSGILNATKTTQETQAPASQLIAWKDLSSSDGFAALRWVRWYQELGWLHGQEQNRERGSHDSHCCTTLLVCSKASAQKIQSQIQPGVNISSTHAARPVSRQQSRLYQTGGGTVVFPAVRLTSLVLYAEH